ncbi:MAG: glutamine--tRNA ligase/YqeY domain fusion protein [Clostridia bacterium]
MEKAKPIEASNFIEREINKDLVNGVYDRVHTRFPPEPNGFLHIGHIKAINIDFGIAKKYNGKCNLRFDDTNPDTEDHAFVKSIQDDIKWLGYDWEDRLFFCSDYFQELYDIATHMITNGDAYVCHLSPEETKKYRGTLIEPGKDSPYRDRTVEENLELFEKMKNGEFEEGECVLRAKIDMQSPNMNMRDPVMYRISYTSHHRTDDQWCIYPMYDYSHPLADALEGITHSLCSKEYEDHRPLYNWFVEKSGLEHKPRQIEFARIYVSDSLTSKRKIKKLTEEGLVEDWTDPRLVTVAGMRRRGYTPEALINFIEAAGVSKADSEVDFAMLEHFIRENLKYASPRVMAAKDPLKVVITNYPEGEIEYLEAPNNVSNKDLGYREIPFGREIYIEREDFSIDPPKGYKRLSPGLEVRLFFAYFIKCNEVITDPSTGEVKELRCTYDVETKSGSGFKGRKPNGTIQWVHADTAEDVEIHIFDKLFKDGYEDSDDLSDAVDLNSYVIFENSKVESSYKDINLNGRFQFIRDSYYYIDPKSKKGNKTVFNQVVSLKSSWK